MGGDVCVISLQVMPFAPLPPTRGLPGCPSGAFHEEAMYIGPFPGDSELLPVLLRHITLQGHLVQRPLIPAGCGLHDGVQEGLGVEEAPPATQSRAWQRVLSGLSSALIRSAGP